MTTFVGCFNQATSETDVTSPNGIAMYYWGLNNKTGTIPMKFGVNNIINKVEKLGQTSYDISYGNKKTEDIEVPQVPMINGLPFFAVLGKQTQVTLDQRRTISHLTTTRKPRYTCALQLDALDPQVRYGVFFHTLRVSHTIGDPVQFSMQGVGCKPDRPAATFLSTGYPSSESKPFDICNYLKIGADGSEATIDAPSMVEFAAVQDCNAFLGASGYPDYIHDFKPIDTYISITLQGAQNTILDYAEDKTEVSILWKCSKSSVGDTAHYFELDSVGATACIEAMNPISLTTGEVIAWNTVFKLEKPTIDVNDYIDTDFYTIPT
jgi:hypothetical protein